MIAEAADVSSMDRKSFRAIADLAYKDCGLIIVDEKMSMVCSRLRHRLRALGHREYDDYCAFLLSDKGREERRHLVSALTTNVSYFFREAHHFEKLAEKFKARLPKLRAGGEMRIWSAGCANGQEPLSAAIRLLETDAGASDLDLRILATDVDQDVVRFARRAAYPERMMQGLSPELRSKFFVTKKNAVQQREYVAGKEIKDLIRVRELNLLGNWPMKKRFDVIFCRNVVIYFDLLTQVKLWPRLQAALAPGGLLFLGHSERIADPAKYGFECIGPTTYRPIPRKGPNP